MSEKRFVLDDSYLIDTKGRDILGYNINSDLVDLLNSLAEENEQLKSTIIHLEEECGARENDYVNLKNQLNKIPPKIKEVWLNG